jgi:hypothetical protein
MANSKGLLEQALPTARIAFGALALAAISVKVVVCPNGIAMTARHTRFWKGVPRISSGRSRAPIGASMEINDASDHFLRTVDVVLQGRAGEALLQNRHERFRIGVFLDHDRNHSTRA